MITRTEALAIANHHFNTRGREWSHLAGLARNGETSRAIYDALTEYHEEAHGVPMRCESRLWRSLCDVLKLRDWVLEECIKRGEYGWGGWVKARQKGEQR